MTEPAALETSPGERLEAAFRAVQRERMRDVPILNEALRVEAVGFRPWDAHWLGILVTPWFMNLMLLPRERDRWLSLRPGDKRTHAFPAGAFEFVAGREAAIGEYEACSLFSPMFEFTDHEAACATAVAALDALFDAENLELTDMALVATDEVPPSIAADAAAQAEASGPGPLAELAEKAHAPMSKREFLRGGVFRDDRGDRG